MKKVKEKERLLEMRVVTDSCRHSLPTIPASPPFFDRRVKDRGRGG